MLGYNAELKKVEETIQQLYRNFALRYSEIRKSELSEREKEIELSELLANTTNTERILMHLGSLSELSSEDRERLGITEEKEPVVDEGVIDTLVAIYAKRAKTPNTRNRNTNILKATTLVGDEVLEEIDTVAFEEELRQYFTEHYTDLLSDGYNSFLSEATEVPDDIGILNKRYGSLAKIAMKHNIDPHKFNCFGYQIRVQDGLVAEEDSSFGRSNIFYATPKGINNRIFDLWSKVLYREQKGNEKDMFSEEIRRLKNTYISFAEENGIEIENPDVLETLEVDMVKVQALARYINKVINSIDDIEKGDYTQQFADDIIRNYSKIMNLHWYSFGDLESVEKVLGKKGYIKGLHLYMEEDNITNPHGGGSPEIVYGTPEYIKNQYESVMEQVRTFHSKNAFMEGGYEFEKINRLKQALRRYIKEQGIEGIDISIPQVEVNHDITNSIVDSLMKRYGAEYEDKDTMRSRILSKLESNWSEIITERQYVDIYDLFKDELEEMGHTYCDHALYVKEDFVYLTSYMITKEGECIYATPEAIKTNIASLDSRIETSDDCRDEESKRKILQDYAKKRGFELDIPDVESVKNIWRQEKEVLFDWGLGNSGFGFVEPDDPTARSKIDAKDTIIDIIVKMSGGNPGAVVALTSVVKADATGGMLLLDLDDMNIRESQIWTAYKYLYNEDAERFAEAIRNRDSKMVDFINEKLASVGGEKAVVRGASFDRSKTPNKYRFTQEEVEQLKQQREERIVREREQRTKMIANSPAKKNKGAKKRAEREAKRQAYRQKLIAMGKRSLGELDEELTELQEKEEQAKELCEQYEQQLTDKSYQEL